MTPTDNTGNQILEVIAEADKFNHWMYQTIKPFFEGETLEIGSGIGNISSFVVADNFSITLSDTDDRYLETLKNKFSNFRNVEDILNIDLQHPSFRTEYLTLKGKFDTVFLLNVLEHVADDSLAIINCKYLLKDEGQLIILTPAYTSLYSSLDKALGHYRRYRTRNLKAIFKKNQLVTKKAFYFNSLGVFAWLYAKFRKLKTIPVGEMKVFNKLVPLSKLMDKIFFRKFGLSVIIIGEKVE